MRRRTMATEVLDIVLRLVAAGLLGACIGFERRIHHKAIGIAGMVLIASWQHNLHAARPTSRRARTLLNGCFWNAKQRSLWLPSSNSSLWPGARLTRIMQRLCPLTAYPFRSNVLQIGGMH